MEARVEERLGIEEMIVVNVGVSHNCEGKERDWAGARDSWKVQVI